MSGPRVLRRAAVALTLLIGAVGLTSSAEADVPTIGNSSDLGSLLVGFDYSFDADAPVLRLYQAFFNRTPDLDGAKYWLGVRRQQFDALAIAGFMSDSAEFNNAYAGTDNAEFTRRVYSNVLGRNFDQAGYDYWLDLLNKGPAAGGLSRPDMVFYVTQNEEFIVNFPFGEPEGPAATFADGTYDVGNGPNDVPPFEVYVSVDAQANCEWATLSAFDGQPTSVVQSGSYPEAQPQVFLQIVDEIGVQSQNCGTFYPLNLVDLTPPEALTSGTFWMQGTQYEPGLYVNRPGGADCGAFRHSSFAGGSTSITGSAFIFDAEQIVIELPVTDAAASFLGDCSGWQRFEDSAQAVLELFPPRETFGNGVFIVSADLPVGAVYETAGLAGGECKLTAVKDLVGEDSSILDSFVGQEGQGAEITVERSWSAVIAQDCGTFTRVG